MSDMVLEKEVFIPESKYLEIGDRKYDLSEIPFEFSLRFYEMLPIFQNIGEGKFITSTDYNAIFPIIFDMLKFIDETTEEKWLRKKITLKTFSPILTTISAAIFFDGKKKEDEEQENIVP
jgi:hypothetical protein